MLRWLWLKSIVVFSSLETVYREIGWQNVPFMIGQEKPFYTVFFKSQAIFSVKRLYEIRGFFNTRNSQYVRRQRLPQFS